MAVPVGGRCELRNLPADASPEATIKLIWGTAHRGALGFSVHPELLTVRGARPKASPFSENVPVFGVQV
jgi:hypothetical protein